MPHMHKCIFSLLTEQNECFQNSELTFIVYGENQSMQPNCGGIWLRLGISLMVWVGSTVQS